MDLGNLATVICPSILYSRGRDAVRDESFGAIRVITALLENQDEFFTVPEEFLRILDDQEYFASSMDLPGKEFMKKCDTYQKVKASNGRIPGMPYNGLNGSTPRFPPPTSPNPDRPPMGVMGAPLPSDRNIRPHPGMLPPNSFQGQVGSPSMQSMMASNSPRTPTDEWPATPRPGNPNNTSSSRPSSYIQPRPSTEQPNGFTPSANGYPTAVRQRT